MSVTGKKISGKEEAGHTMLLVAAALLWGFTFVAQSRGAEHVGTFTFIAVRNWLAAAFLIPVIYVSDLRSRRRTGRTRRPVTVRQKKLTVKAGLVCGLFLLTANALQQYGIVYTTTARAGFITALYVVIVPLFAMLVGHKQDGKIWICVVMSLVGLYLLCMKGGFAGLNKGDVIMFISAFLFAMQIMALSRYTRFVDGLWLSLGETLTNAVISTFPMFLLERPALADIRAAALPILYAGIVSSGIAYTFQIIGQKDLNPTVASLAMCLESVFSALGGWLLLGQTLTGRELTGCIVMFAAIVLSQLPVRKLWSAAKMRHVRTEAGGPDGR